MMSRKVIQCWALNDSPKTLVLSTAENKSQSLSLNSRTLTSCTVRVFAERQCAFQFLLGEAAHHIINSLNSSLKIP